MNEQAPTRSRTASSAPSSRVLICDDQELIRMGLRMVVDSQPDLTVVGEAADGDAAIAGVAALEPDLVLMDVRMPGLDGLAATEILCAQSDGPRILLVTTFDLDEYAYAALRAGANGFLVKDAPAEEILVTVRAVLRGETMVAPSLTRRLVERFVLHAPATAPAQRDRLAALTEREREVLALVAKGLANGEIADRLFVGETTVKTHLGRILTKLGLRDRIHAVIFAYESGLVRVGD
ncbi:DNA-binding response regulator, NarL/FixJ family, contains REC and HTH domains [Streptomyces sp. 3213]|uniref:response regulator n=1 Tax=Streptomyces sp. 3213.3 TaxID=1855348 RepID=UPI000896D92A|nr:response regulator transcription factor [Streptomyces sp. 3213.3]SEC73369.1 DNA-binding response regulator, NarL/FixJ family, contains REC and HTH domains [Streptomyces sp. 3213] [Streptomyces sp. 3213.3]